MSVIFFPVSFLEVMKLHAYTLLYTSRYMFKISKFMKNMGIFHEQKAIETVDPV